MTESVMYRWDDDKGGRSVCSECLRAFGNAAVCRHDPNPQGSAREVCEDELIEETA
ncbi:MAG: hypothetical protein ABSD96_04720 [Candidatus Korobacteraceae bacterium]|jgi:hypothetical protein